MQAKLERVSCAIHSRAFPTTPSSAPASQSPRTVPVNMPALWVACDYVLVLLWPPPASLPSADCVSPCSLLFSWPLFPLTQILPPNTLSFCACIFLAYSVVCLRSATCCRICPALLGLARTFPLSSQDVLLLPRPECRRAWCLLSFLS